ncbi:MAG: AtpZ/AtpI family protein [Planctomycetota bacterium]
MSDRPEQPEQLDPPRRPSGAPEIPEVLRQTRSTSEPKSPRRVSSLAEGFALGTDLLVSIAVGIGLGYLADCWLGTSPWGLLLGMAAGMGGAISRLIRRQNRSRG